MKVGLFTDTYFPQVSGVATSIRTLKEELEKAGHEVYVFTTTDKGVKRYEDPTIIRLPSVPFISFTDRRVAYRGLMTSLKIAKEYQLDIIHTQTEFSLGLLGKMVARALKIPVVHTYHTQYEDYVDYFAGGKIIRPSMVKYIVRGYLNDLDGVICPSPIVSHLLDGYDIKVPKRIISTGIPIERFSQDDLPQEKIHGLREKLGILPDGTMLLSLSRISSEKNIQAVLASLPEVLAENPKVTLVVAGDGPYLDKLKAQAKELAIENHVVFTGMIAPEETVLYYKSCDFFVSASTSETQGLTYLESLASGRPIIAHGNPYLDHLVSDKAFGTLYYQKTELASAILDAIACTPKMTVEQLASKRVEISSKHFGEVIYQFYLDVIISNAAKGKHKRDKLSLHVKGEAGEPVLELSQVVRELPARAVKNTSQVLKAPFKLVKGLRKFLD